jgi:hypothetical protein
MGLKGYRLWINLIQRAEPHLEITRKRHVHVQVYHPVVGLARFFLQRKFTFRTSIDDAQYGPRNQPDTTRG